MESRPFIEKGFDINLSSPEWDRVVKRFEMSHNLTLDDLECEDGIRCKIGYADANGKVLVTPTLGLMIATTAGLLILCPSEDNVPIAALIPKENMKVVGIEKKLFNTTISIETKAGKYLFVTNKHKSYECEQIISNVKEIS